MVRRTGDGGGGGGVEMGSKEKKEREGRRRAAGGGGGGGKRDTGCLLNHEAADCQFVFERSTGGAVPSLFKRYIIL